MVSCGLYLTYVCVCGNGNVLVWAFIAPVGVLNAGSHCIHVNVAAGEGIWELAVYRVLSMMIWLRNLFGFVPHNLPIYMLILMRFGYVSSSTSLKDNIPGKVKQVQKIITNKLSKQMWSIRASDSSFCKKKILNLHTKELKS